jgi:putative transposase
VLLSKWKTQALEGLPRLFENDRKSERARDAAQAQQRDELFAQIGRLTTQLDWLKKKSGLEPVER